jgi:hypothetical protein
MDATKFPYYIIGIYIPESYIVYDISMGYMAESSSVEYAQYIISSILPPFC